MRQEIVRRQNICNHRPGLGKGQGVAASPLAFALNEGVRDSGQDDVSMPAGERTPFEMVETQFVFQFGVLLLDRPAVMRLSRRGRADRTARSPGRRGCPPVARGRHATRTRSRAHIAS